MVPTQEYSQGSPPRDDMDALFDQVANSAIFGSAPIMKTLLLYLWRHRTESVSEYAIAVEALGRPPNFDPKIDAAVRVQVGRLRSKLKRFYEAEGDSSPLKLSIPLGGHQ